MSIVMEKIAALTAERDQLRNGQAITLAAQAGYLEQTGVALAMIARLVEKDLTDERTDGYPFASCSFCGGLFYQFPEWPLDVEYTREEMQQRQAAFVPHTDHTPDCPLIAGRALIAKETRDDDDCPFPAECAADDRCKGECW